MMSRSSAKGIWSRQKLVVSGLRSLLIIILGLAVADPQLMKFSNQVNVFFCLDVSDSIPREQKMAAEAFMKKTVAEMKGEDQAGLIVFGKRPSVELSLRTNFDPPTIRSDVNSNHTSIYNALQLAIGKLPQKGTNKIVIFTDGNETQQHSLDMAYLAGSLGIEIYPVPLASWFGTNEVYIKTLETPPHAALETPFEIRLVVISATENQGQ
ncbi:MAG: vWA domain-containing protein, partial [Desulfobacterales bacterium]